MAIDPDTARWCVNATLDAKDLTKLELATLLMAHALISTVRITAEAAPIADHIAEDAKILALAVLKKIGE